MIYNQLHNMENLLEAWKHVRSKRSAPGIDRVRVEDFEKNLDANLKTLQQELKSEQYRPLPVMAYNERKSKSKFRPVGVSTVRDRIVQQVVVNTLKPRFESLFLPCSFAYRPKKSALLAVKQAGECIKQGNLWALKMDVDSFFDSIDHDLLLEMIGSAVNEKSLHRLISNLLKTKIFREMGLFDNTVGSCQGSGLSPLLSNIYLHPLDREMWKIYKGAYLRFSDDIAVFAGEKDQLEAARDRVKLKLAELKLSVNNSKMSISHVSAGIIYLGFYLDIKGKGPSSKSIEQIHEKLELLAPVRKSDNIRERLKDVEQQIRGWYNYYKSLKAITPPDILSLITVVKLSQEFNEIQYAKDLLRQHEVYGHKHPDISFVIGELFQSLGMHPQAVREFARALELNPDMGAARDKIRTLQKSEQDIHQAIDQLKTVIHKNPYYREGYEELAHYYAKLGLYGYAEKANQKALELDSESRTGFTADNSPPDENHQDIRFSFAKDDQQFFMELFAGRHDAHGRQWIDERGKCGFIRVERPMKSRDIYKHLQGEDTLAVFPVTIRDTVNFIVFDVDISKKELLKSSEGDLNHLRKKTHGDILRIRETCAGMGLFLYIEDSGYKGRHGWLLFSEEIPARKAVLLGEDILKRSGTPSNGVVWELFPRGKIGREQQLIKLPLGINLKSSRRCLFLKDDGPPEQNQLSFLKSIRRNPPDSIRPARADEEKTDSGVVDGKDQISAPSALKDLVNGCKIIRHLIRKAVDTNYLNHYERICLLYTLTFAGDDGVKFLHKVLGYCLNYDYYVTQRHIDQRKESPISCARIMENFFDLSQTYCRCGLKPPPRGYPSPVLYILKGEMSRCAPAKNPASQTDEKNLNSEKPAENRKKEAESEEKPAVLDFEAIFSEELDGPGKIDSLSDDTVSEPDPEDTKAARAAEPIRGKNDVSPETSASDTETGETVPLRERKEISAVQGDLSELILTYLGLKREKLDVDRRMRQISEQINGIVDNTNSDVIETPIGAIQKIRNDSGDTEWTLHFHL